VKIHGLDKLSRELGEFSKAIADLEGDITEVRFDPNDPVSIEQAVKQMEAAIDARIEPYSQNSMVTSLVSEMKERYREAILEKATQARLEVGEE